MGKVLSKLQHRIGLHSLVSLFEVHKIWLLIRSYELKPKTKHFTRALSNQLRAVFDSVAVAVNVGVAIAVGFLFRFVSIADGSSHLITNRTLVAL